MTSDQQERARVRSRIEALIMEFLRSVSFSSEDGIFYMGTLTRYVQDRAKVAPDSPGRVLREMRREGRVSVKLVKRSESLYRAERPAEQAELFEKTA